MNPEIESSLERIEDGAERIAAGTRGSLRGLVAGARERGLKAAAAVSRGKRPLHALSGLGHKLSAVSHRTTDRVLTQQAELAAHQLDLLAERLQRAAGAASLRELLGSQVRLTPEQFRRLGTDARASFRILAEGGIEARDAIRGTFGELAGGKPATRRPAKKAAKKPARRKASAKRSAKPAKTARKTAAARRTPATDGPAGA